MAKDNKVRAKVSGSGNLIDIMSDFKEQIHDKVEFSQYDDAYTTESFVDDGSVQAIASLPSSATSEDEVSRIAGAMASMASTDYAETFRQFEKNGMDEDPHFTVESFSSATPEDIASYNFGFNYGASKQEPFLEGIYPTILQPVGTRAVKVEVDVDYVIDPYTRLDGSYGSTKDNAVPFVKTINDEDFYKNVNELIPTSDRKVEWDKFFAKDLETEVVEPNSGTNIKTAPYLAGVEIPVIDICQTSLEISTDTFSQRTQLAPFPSVESLIFKVDAEYLEIDVSKTAYFGFTETAEGDDRDIGLLASTNLVVTPSAMVDKLTGVATAVMPNIPTNYKIVYKVLFTGEGNLRDGGFAIYGNKVVVHQIIDAGGLVVPTTHADYADYLADAEKLSTESFHSFTAKSHIVNDDLSRTGKLLTLRSKSQEYILEPNTPLSVEAPLTSLIRGSGKTDAVYIPFLVRHSLAGLNQQGVRSIVEYANYLRNNVGDTGLDLETLGVSRFFITPWFKSESLDLSTSVDSLTAQDRAGDIKATFDNVVKRLISEMFTVSGYNEAVVDVKSTLDVWVGVHSSLAVFVGDTVDCGSRYDVRIFSTNRKIMEDRCYIVPANFSSTRNTEIDIFSFGAHLYTPVLIGERGKDKNREITAQIVNTHATFTPIMAELTVSGLEGVVRKVAQLARV